MTLTFESTGFASGRHRILDAAGREVGTLVLARWRDAATLTLGGVDYAVRKDPSDGAVLVVGPDGLPVAQAATPSVVSTRYRLDWGDGQGDLTRTSLWPWAPFAVDGDDGTRLVRIEPNGFRRSRLVVGTVDAWPLARTAFVATLALFVLRRQRRRHRV